MFVFIVVVVVQDDDDDDDDDGDDDDDDDDDDVDDAHDPAEGRTKITALSGTKEQLLICRSLAPNISRDQLLLLNNLEQNPDGNIDSFIPIDV